MGWGSWWLCRGSCREVAGFCCSTLLCHLNKLTWLNVTRQLNYLSSSGQDGWQRAVRTLHGVSGFHFSSLKKKKKKKVENPYIKSCLSAVTFGKMRTGCRWPTSGAPRAAAPARVSWQLLLPDSLLGSHQDPRRPLLRQLSCTGGQGSLLPSLCPFLSTLPPAFFKCELVVCSDSCWKTPCVCS